MVELEQVTLLASAARTASVNSAAQANRKHKGVIVNINVTADPALASVVFTIQGQDPISGEWYDILTSAAVAAVGHTVLRVYPGLVAVTNLAISYPLPSAWRVRAVAADGDSLTYSVGAVFLP
jgi:hypothetical protein